MSSLNLSPAFFPPFRDHVVVDICQGHVFTDGEGVPIQVGNVTLVIDSIRADLLSVLTLSNSFEALLDIFLKLNADIKYIKEHFGNEDGSFLFTDDFIQGLLDADDPKDFLAYVVKSRQQLTTLFLFLEASGYAPWVILNHAIQVASSKLRLKEIIDAYVRDMQPVYDAKTLKKWNTSVGDLF